MKRSNGVSTDWTEYYNKKKNIASSLTQKITLKKILYYMDKYCACDGIELLELGGGNSCFATQICNAEKVNKYDIIDNNELAVKLFNDKSLETSIHIGYQIDLLKDDDSISQKYDFVYSVGLIEHFRSSNIDKVIEKHFDFCKQDGIVLISFPTPTRKYKAIRRIMELFGIWQFWDECPLRLEDVMEIAKHGKILSTEINKKLPLSQMIVVAKKTV